MSLIAVVFAQVAVEYGVISARGAFADVQRTLTSVSTGTWLIAVAVLVGLYLLVKRT
jgi:hypothetical protein